jgi:predicted DNA-binding ribbon-helix-helix protein
MSSKSGITKRSIVINGHKTSVSMEDKFWKGLKDAAEERKITLSKLVADDIDANREARNLSCSIRLFVYQLALDKVALLEAQALLQGQRAA